MPDQLCNGARPSCTNGQQPAAHLPGSAEPQLGSNDPQAELGLGVPRGVPKGYKRTEVGVIPEEWGTESIANLVKPDAPICYGVVQVGKNVENVENGVPIVAIKYVKEIAYAPLHRTATELERPFARSRAVPGDVLISIKGTIGRVGIVPSGFIGNISRELARIRVKAGFSSEYVAHQLENESTQDRIMRSVVGTTRLEFSIAAVRQFLLAIPATESEQRAIASALGDVDALLGALDAAIAKQRDLKQAAMQQLLTGQTRLPGFQGEWEVKRLGELTWPRRDRVDPSQLDLEGPCVELEHIESETGRLLGCTEIRQGSSLKSCFYAGDVLFGKLRAYLKKFWLADREGFCSTEIWVFPPDANKMAAGFLSQIVRTDDFVDAASLSYGTHMPRSDWKVVQNFEVKVPCVDEQQAIASILSDMDAKVTALESRRTKTAAIKQAMMQELLTGRTRLV